MWNNNMGKNSKVVLVRLIGTIETSYFTKYLDSFQSEEPIYLKDYCLLF